MSGKVKMICYKCGAIYRYFRYYRKKKRELKNIMRRILFNICGIIAFTDHNSSAHAYLPLPRFISATRQVNPRRSSNRNKARPAETATNGSCGAMSVQSSGTEDLSPFVLKKKTRYSPGNRLTLSISNFIFLNG